MKVVLLEDVKKVGKKGEIVEVSDAYGRNVLIKKGLGLEGTATNVNNAKQSKNPSLTIKLLPMMRLKSWQLN